MQLHERLHAGYIRRLKAAHVDFVCAYCGEVCHSPPWKKKYCSHRCGSLAEGEFQGYTIPTRKPKCS